MTVTSIVIDGTSTTTCDPAKLTGIKVFIYVFDLLELDGRDLTGLPLRERKSILKSSLEFHGPVRYTPHRNEKGEKFFLEACLKGWEGLIAKRADSTYQHSRSNDWLKIKCAFDQELVIGGFTPPKGSRERFGALLVGYNEGGDLRYAGKVGTGFDHATLEALGDKMDALRQEKTPFTAGSGLPRDDQRVDHEHRDHGDMLDGADDHAGVRHRAEPCVAAAVHSS